MQFALSVIAGNPAASTHPDFLAAAKAVRITGVMDKETIHAIRQLPMDVSAPPEPE